MCQDTFYDVVDTLDTLGMEDTMKALQKMNNKDIIEQCKVSHLLYGKQSV